MPPLQREIYQQMSMLASELAMLILRDHEDRAPFDETTGRLDIRCLDEAYAIQGAYVAGLLKQFGGPAGYKIGLTSPVMQKMCGITTPVAGVILGRRVHATATRLPLANYVNPGIEFEIAVRLASEFSPDAAPFSYDAIAQAIDGVCPAFEIIDDRGADYSRLDVRALIADNAWNAGIVLGEFRSDWPDLGAVRGIVECNDVVVAEGTGHDVLGHPLNPVVWLANHLAARNLSLRPGDIVLTGSLARTRFVSPGEHYRLTIEQVGCVEVTFAA
jgi:2-keto-4-pentenoate hydratase